GVVMGGYGLYLTFSVCCIAFSLFFFSSRRRHTRFSRDWSSDVCSSDLSRLPSVMQPCRACGVLWETEAPRKPRRDPVKTRIAAEIGRASCRERVEISAVAGAIKKRQE